MGLLGRWPRHLVGATLCLLVVAAATTHQPEPYNDTLELKANPKNGDFIDAALPYRCDFEVDLCGTSQYKGNPPIITYDPNDWNRSTNVTVSVTENNSTEELTLQAVPKAAAGEYFAYLKRGDAAAVNLLQTPRLNVTRLEKVCVSLAVYFYWGTASPPETSPLKLALVKNDGPDYIGLPFVKEQHRWYFYQKTADATNLKRIQFYPSIAMDQGSFGMVAIDHLSVVPGPCAEDCNDCRPAPTTALTTAPTYPEAATATTVSGSTAATPESETTTAPHNIEETSSITPQQFSGLSAGALGGIVGVPLTCLCLSAIIILLVAMARRKHPATTDDANELNELNFAAGGEYSEYSDTSMGFGMGELDQFV